MGVGAHLENDLAKIEKGKERLICQFVSTPLLPLLLFRTLLSISLGTANYVHLFSFVLSLAVV